MNNPSETDIAWAAGLFEGEGNIGVENKNLVNSKRRFEPRLQMPITDLDVLQKFQAVWGVGKVSGPFTQKKSPGAKPYWRWGTYSWDEFVAIGGAMRPWFGQRRGARYDFILAQMPEHFRKPTSFVPCDYAPTPSVAGYLKHRRKGERACAVCMESSRLYYAEYLPKWRAARALRQANLQK
jgi:hypothetical protein